VKFDIEDCYENLSRKSKSGEKWVKVLGTLHEDVSFSVTGNIKSPQKHYVQLKWLSGCQSICKYQPQLGGLM
jgi:hypothetical protein